MTNPPSPEPTPPDEPAQRHTDDPGFARERSALAWRRTGLSVLVVALVIGRMALDTVGVGVVLPVAAALSASAWVTGASLRRRRRARAGHGPAVGWEVSDGRLPLAMAGVVALLCLAELTSVLVR